MDSMNKIFRNLSVRREVTIEDARERKGRMIFWISVVFAIIAVLIFIISPMISDITPKPLYQGQGVGYVENTLTQKDFVKNIQTSKARTQATPSFENFTTTGLDEGMRDTAFLSMPPTTILPTYPNDDSVLLHKTDNREFLKIYYNAQIKARNTVDTVSDIRTIVHSFNGRVDSSNSSNRNGYVSFSVPVSQFDAFRLQIKNLTHNFLFVENTSSDNLLSQKQAIEEDIVNTQDSLTSLKSEKAMINQDHDGMIAFLNMKLDGLNKESGLLQAEWQTATASRKLEITARLAQIQGEKNLINSQIQTENVNYSKKISAVNSKISGKQNNLKVSLKENQNLIDTVSMVTGTISVEHVNLWQYADAFMPGPLLAWVFTLAALVMFIRYWFIMRMT